jgi:hypothetical protein
MLYATERIPLQDLIKWLTTKAKELQNERWSTCNNTMRERKGKAEWSKDTEGLGRRDQVKISRVRTGYTRVNHGYIGEKHDSPECPFCKSKIRLEHVLWACGETEQKCREMNMNKNIWNERYEGTLQLIDAI